MKISKALWIGFVTFFITTSIYAQNARSLVMEMLAAASTGNESKVFELKVRIDLLAKPEKGGRKIARSLNENALKQLNEKNFDGAVKIFEQALETDRSDVEIINNLGYAQLKGKQYSAAQNTFFDALAIDPGRTGAWFNLGEVYSQLGDQLNAVAAFDIAYSFSKNKDKTKQFLEKSINEPGSSSTLIAAAKDALKHEGINGALGQSEHMTIAVASKDINHNAKVTSSEPSLATAAPVRESENQCAQIQIPADRVWCWRLEVNRKSKELDELKLKYNINDLIIPSCTGLKAIHRT